MSSGDGEVDLKQFISTTIKAIAESTIDLQDELSAKGVVINPMSDHESSQSILEESSAYQFRRVINVDFDVALTVSDSQQGGGHASIKVMSLEIGGSGDKNISKESVSRVKFSMPIALSVEDSFRGKINQATKRSNLQTGWPVDDPYQSS